MTDQAVPAGWYYMQGDPPQTQRWWDGAQWTGEAQPVQAAAPQPAVPMQESQPAAAMQQPVAAGVAAQSSGVEYGSMLTNDLDAYWASMEDPVDPAADFADSSSWDQDPADGEGSDTEEFPQRPPGVEGDGSSMSPIAWALLPFKKFAKFSGRSCRAEYWWFTLMNTLVFVALYAGIFLTVPPAGTVAPGDDLPPAMSLLFGAMLIYSLIVAIPSWAVTVRRLHDTGRSGWAVLIGAIPFIGGLWLLVIYATPGDSGWNKYGDSHLTPER